MIKKGFFAAGFIAVFFLFAGCRNQSADTFSDASDSIFKDESRYYILKNKTVRPAEFSISENIRVILDSLSEIKVMDSLRQGYQLLNLNGEAHFYVKNTGHPVLIYTGMMKLESESVDFQIDAYKESPGQSLKVFDGQLIATKSYKSDFPNTDTLHKGDMILINRDIDLMEKETFDTTKTF